jgi:hypothetical protein
MPRGIACAPGQMTRCVQTGCGSMYKPDSNKACLDLQVSCFKSFSVSALIHNSSPVTLLVFIISTYRPIQPSSGPQ